ncbi:unnamed protein product [Nesidiocoris tenuis]|uniref:Uncharacterized protein n=1 Tax=Nesidiocoris tenuis TaxID=355587 RepID=A0A6H5HAZ8_9HEMI|nr:unnamed protein product [Nesidiocoris tenuis]
MRGRGAMRRRSAARGATAGFRCQGFFAIPANSQTAVAERRRSLANPDRSRERQLTEGSLHRANYCTDSIPTARTFHFKFHFYRKTLTLMRNIMSHYAGNFSGNIPQPVVLRSIITALRNVTNLASSSLSQSFFRPKKSTGEKITDFTQVLPYLVLSDLQRVFIITPYFFGYGPLLLCHRVILGEGRNVHGFAPSPLRRKVAGFPALAAQLHVGPKRKSSRTDCPARENS